MNIKDLQQFMLICKALNVDPTMVNLAKYRQAISK